MSDDARRKILARRARFVAATLAGAAISTVAGAARADDASIDDDGGDPIAVEAGVRSDAGDEDIDAAPPTPCLSMKKPEDPKPCLSSCAATPTSSSAPIAPAIAAAAAAAIAARRQKRKKKP